MFPCYLSYSLWLPVVNCGLSSLLIQKSCFLLNFLRENSNKKSFGLPGGNVNVMQNFCRSCLIIKTTSCQKRSLCYKETLTKPRSCRDSYSTYTCTYGSRIMCSLSVTDFIICCILMLIGLLFCRSHKL